MAFLYRRKGSPYWWVSYLHAGSGRRVYVSTGLRHSHRNETRLAHVRVLELGLSEFATKRQSPDEAWSRWVEAFLDSRYARAEQVRTLERYRTAWRNVLPFLEEHGLHLPRMVKREDLYAFIKWRQQTRNDRVRPCSYNTAQHEVKTLGIILHEAVLRGYCAHNPAREMGLRKQPPKEKPELTPEDIVEIRQRLRHEPDWMRVSFEISIHHGTRLRATQVDLQRDIDWTAGTITFHEKGNKLLTVPIAPELRPLLERRRAEGHRFSCLLPRGASKAWRSFFNRMGRRDFCFHCCRVTTVSRLARAGVSEAIAKRFVGHASTEIHRSYQRLGVRDLVACHVPIAGGVGLDSSASTQTFKSPTESLV